MISSLVRAWRGWRAKWRLTAPLWKPVSGRVLTRSLLDRELRKVLAANGPELPPYHGLAGFWDGYAAGQLPDYPTYLAEVARLRGKSLGSVLDLACGTGLLTERLTRVADEVVGLDASPDMLAAAATRLGGTAGVSFARGDFRDFALGRQFDAAVCASNSLNYVTGRRDLNRVFAAVGRHLRSGGLFVFDTSTAKSMSTLSGLWLNVEADRGRFALGFSYDARRREQTSRVVLPTGVEVHRRIPLDRTDVRAAAEGSGLTVADHFDCSLVPWNPLRKMTSFHVLTKGD